MSKYKTLPRDFSSLKSTFQSDEPPYSIPGVHLPMIEVYDDILDKDLHDQVWKYLLSRVWHQLVAPGINPELQLYKPSDWDDSWVNPMIIKARIWQPRTLFASDEASLKKLHPLIHQLWLAINERLGNRYEISGIPEGTKFVEYPCPDPEDPNLSKGWRVYANASLHDQLGNNGYAHRDNKDLHDDTSVTMLYMANPVWYPTWAGDIHFYPEDPTGETGDHQQFNDNNQQRNFNIGWLDQGKSVSLKPNRLLIYDSRALHSTPSTAHRNNNELHRRIAFRARLKKS
jgi:hypothetical protein